MNKITKRLAIACMVLSCGLCVGLMSACDKNESKDSSETSSSTNGVQGSENEKEMCFLRTSLSVLVCEDIRLAIAGDYTAEEITWESSDESIATVNNGLVTTKKVGTVTITISKDGLKDECVLTVKETSIIPNVTLNLPENKLSLNKNFVFDLEPALSYNKTEYSDFVVTYECSDENVASVDKNGKVTALKVGKANIDVHVTWRGFEMDIAIALDVITDNYVSIDGKTFDLYLVEVEGYDLPTQGKVTPTLNGLEDVIEGGEFSVREVVEDGAETGLVATCTNDGQIQAVGLGTATFEFVCEYEGDTYVSSPFTVTVHSFTWNLKKDLYAEISEGSIIVNIAEFMEITSLESVTLDGEPITFSGTTFTAQELSYGAHEVCFTANGEVGLEYKTKLLVADKVIATVEDFAEFNADGYNVLAADIDFEGTALTLGTLNGVLDGNGHVIFNVTNDNIWAGIFSIISNTATVKNIGFYNIASTRADQYNFALVGELHGTLENISFHQGGTGKIGALINKVVNGSKIKNFVAYANQTVIGGFFSSGHKNSLAEADNIFIFTNTIATNPNAAASGVFMTGEGGFDYLETEEYKAVNFSKIFDCSETGMWKLDGLYGIPFVTKENINVKTEIGEQKTYEGQDIAVTDISFTDIGRIEISGVELTESDYTVDNGTITIKASFLNTLTDYKNTLTIVSKDELSVYQAEILKYTYVSTYAELLNITQAPSGYYILTQDIDCGGAALVLGNFDGTLDGAGYTISNVTNSNTWGGIFGTISANAVVKNVGFYNIASTRQDQYNFALAGELHGTLQNVSFHQGGTGYIGALFNKVVSGCKIENFVAYTTLVKINGFFSSGAKSYFAKLSNAYIFTASIEGNAAAAVEGAYFLTGTTGTDYLETEAYKAIDFTSIFDCSATGIWEMDTTLGIPLIKRA